HHERHCGAREHDDERGHVASPSPATPATTPIAPATRKPVPCGSPANTSAAAAAASEARRAPELARAAGTASATNASTRSGAVGTTELVLAPNKSPAAVAVNHAHHNKTATPA